MTITNVKYLIFSISLFPLFCLYFFLYRYFFNGIITYWIILLIIIYVLAINFNLFVVIWNNYFEINKNIFILDFISKVIRMFGLIYCIIPLLLIYIWLNIEWNLVFEVYKEVIKSIIDFWNTQI